MFYKRTDSRFSEQQIVCTQIFQDTFKLFVIDELIYSPSSSLKKWKNALPPPPKARRGLNALWAQLTVDSLTEEKHSSITIALGELYRREYCQCILGCWIRLLDVSYLLHFPSNLTPPPPPQKKKHFYNCGITSFFWIHDLEYMLSEYLIWTAKKAQKFNYSFYFNYCILQMFQRMLLTTKTYLHFYFTEKLFHT